MKKALASGVVWLWYLRLIIVAYTVAVLLASKRLAYDDIFLGFFLILSLSATYGIWITAEIVGMLRRRGKL